MAGIIVVEGILCPSHLDLLDKPNCGEKDPECPVQAPFHTANVSQDDNFLYVQTSYCPPYDWSCLKSPKGRRPCARAQTFKIPKNPSVAKSPIALGLGWPRGGPKDPLTKLRLDEVTPMLGAIGVLVNGVSLNGVASKYSETLEAGQKLDGDDMWIDAAQAEKWMDDRCGGHLSGGGNYHIHAGGWHTAEERTSCGLPPDLPGEHSQRLGWAFDGYPIYGPMDEGGVRPSDLDGCGGHERAAQGGYHYHLSDQYPYALECYHGCPEVSNNFRFQKIECIRKDAPKSEEL